MNANGGFSLANNFVVEILETDGSLGAGGIFEFLCDEAQLPNIQAATGTLEGRYTGEGQVNYPHTRVFTEVQLGFQCDANMTPLKYLNDWYGMIFGEMPERRGTTFSNRPDTPLPSNRTNKLQFPKEYCKTVRITKTEIGPNKNNPLRPSVSYLLERAWPFAIDAVPVQFGSNLITKVTCQLYYTRHTIYHNNISAAFPPPPPPRLKGIFNELDPDDPEYANFGLGPGRGS